MSKQKQPLLTKRRPYLLVAAFSVIVKLQTSRRFVPSIGPQCQCPQLGKLSSKSRHVCWLLAAGWAASAWRHSPTGHSSNLAVVTSGFSFLAHMGHGCFQSVISSQFNSFPMIHNTRSRYVDIERFKSYLTCCGGNLFCHEKFFCESTTESKDRMMVVHGSKDRRDGLLIYN